jgi:ubiquinone/menaquinone biosynthesis C-methylase UbiE
LNALRQAIPKPAKKFLRYLYLSALDLSDISERRRDMIPPRTKNFVGGPGYKATGLEFRDLFTCYGGLKPEHRVLDVGCGIGRMAAPLTGYLSSRGEYQGFDIVKMGIVWCRKNITSRYPNFHFVHSDVKNRYYNPDGVYDASSYRFPYQDSAFDFIFLTSVFTHMFTRDLENYAKEISRVLRRGGTSFITMFLLNEESQELIQKKLSNQNFVYPLDGCVTAEPENPEAKLAFEETYVRNLFSRLGLSIREPIHYGAWCGRKDFLSYQDIVIASRE